MERGTDIQTGKGRILVEAEEYAPCAGCGPGHSCVTLRKGGAGTFWIDTPRAGRNGERVMFCSDTGAVIAAGMILFFFPAAMLVAGLFLGPAAAGRLGIEPDAASLLCGAAALIMSYLAIAVISLATGMKTPEGTVPGRMITEHKMPGIPVSEEAGQTE